MFPDLTCDDVFRLETRRLWLRWPRATDAAAIGQFAGNASVAEMTAEIPHPYPQGEAERFILKARADNSSGQALHLVVTLKAATRPLVGLVSAQSATEGEAGKPHDQDVEIGYAMAPEVWGKGYASEAVRALIEVIFSVTPARCVTAKARVMNPASRRVLEKSGFAHAGTGLDLLPARGGLFSCARFRLERAAWQTAACGRRMPPMASQRRNGPEADDGLAEPPFAVPQY
jgi:RimJ/RimL family protein N-acetyltransferase